MGLNMLKWLVIYLLIKLALILFKGESFSEVINTNYEMAANIILVIDLVVTYIESVQKWRKISPESVDTLNSKVVQNLIKL